MDSGAGTNTSLGWGGMLPRLFMTGADEPGTIVDPKEAIIRFCSGGNVTPVGS